MFFWNSLAILMIQQMLAVWPLVPPPFVYPAWKSGISWFTCCWSLAWRIFSITLLVYESESKIEVAQSCPTLCDPMDCTPPGSAGSQREESHPWQGLAAEIWWARSSQISGFPPGISWAYTPKNKNMPAWKKSSQGFSLLHLKGCFNPKTPLVAF